MDTEYFHIWEPSQHSMAVCNKCDWVRIWDEVETPSGWAIRTRYIEGKGPPCNSNHDGLDAIDQPTSGLPSEFFS